MAYRNPKSILGVAARLTRLNSCGIPIDPLVPNSRLQFTAFISVKASPDVETGSQVTQADAGGQICANYRPRNRLKGFNITMILCGLPTVALEMLLHAALLPSADTPGDFKGVVLEDALTAALADPLMLEVWSKNTDVSSCSGDEGAAYVQHLFPLTSNWDISGDLTIDSANLLNVEVTGYGEKNPNWHPSYPAIGFAVYDPGGGDPTGTPTGAPGITTLPTEVDADSWTTGDKADIQAGGPYAFSTVADLPVPLSNLEFAPSPTGS